VDSKAMGYYRLWVITVSVWVISGLTVTSSSIFFLNKHEKNVKGHLVATQSLPYKQIVLTKAYVVKG